MASARPALVARCDIALTDPATVMRQLHDYFADFGRPAAIADRTCRIDTGYGVACIECGACSLRIEACGRDETALAYVKLAMAEQVLALSRRSGRSPHIAWRGDDAAGRSLPYFREMRVVQTALVTPRMRRVRLAGADLARFASGGLHVQLLIPPEGAATVAWPTMGLDGRPAWPTGAMELAARFYTLRHINVERGEVEIDFVLHEGGSYMPGAAFAASAKPGDIVGMTGPCGGGTVDVADAYLLAGDETALPAIGRILETLPEAARATVVLDVADEGERQDLRSRAQLDCRWLFRDGREPGTTTLLADAVQVMRRPTSGTFFAWVACEQNTCRALRSLMRDVMGLSRTEHSCAAYWRRS